MKCLRHGKREKMALLPSFVNRIRKVITIYMLVTFWTFCTITHLIYWRSEIILVIKLQGFDDSYSIYSTQGNSLSQMFSNLFSGVLSDFAVL